MKTMETAVETNLVVSADLFSIVAQGGWVLQGDNLTLTQAPQLRTTSLAVATVFGKRHDHVLRDIRNLECSEEFRRLNFKEATYLVDTAPQRKIAQTPPPKIGGRGTENTPLQARPMVEMTRKGFEFLVLGFTGRKAAQFREAYVERFHQMEEELVKKTNEIERLARFPEHMPYWNVSDDTGKKFVVKRIMNPDFQPIPGVSIRQTAQGEGSYRVNR